MITLTKLNKASDEQYILNSDLIETIEELIAMYKFFQYYVQKPRPA